MLQSGGIAMCSDLDKYFSQESQNFTTSSRVNVMIVQSLRVVTTTTSVEQWLLVEEKKCTDLDALARRRIFLLY